jgi:hypothetical protein
LLMVVLFFAMSNFCRGCNKHHSCNVWLQLAQWLQRRSNGKCLQWRRQWKKEWVSDCCLMPTQQFFSC